MTVRGEPSTIHMNRRLAVVLSHPIQHFCPLYAHWARASGWEIHVFFGSQAGMAPYYDANFGRSITWGGLPLQEFRHTFLNGDAIPTVTSGLDAPSLDTALQAFGPTAVLTYGYDQRLQRRAQAWARRNRVPLVFFSDGELRQHRPRWKLLLKDPIVRHLLRRIDWFIVTGNANEEYYRHYGVPASRMLRGSYPIDRRGYAEAYARRDTLRRDARRRLGVEDDECIISMVGKLVPWKRQCDLVTAVSRMSCGRPVALVIGAGPKQGDWESLGRSAGPQRTIFTGFTPADQLPELYAATDIYVHTSEKEPHSVAVSEAVYMGLPVVISDRCGSYGTDDDVRPGINGFVYRCGDVDELTQQLEWLAMQRNHRESMGRASHKIGRLQQDVVHDEILETLATVIDAGQGLRSSEPAPRHQATVNL